MEVAQQSCVCGWCWKRPCNKVWRLCCCNAIACGDGDDDDDDNNNDNNNDDNHSSTVPPANGAADEIGTRKDQHGRHSGGLHSSAVALQVSAQFMADCGRPSELDPVGAAWATDGDPPDARPPQQLLIDVELRSAGMPPQAWPSQSSAQGWADQLLRDGTAGDSSALEMCAVLAPD